MSMSVSNAMRGESSVSCKRCGQFEIDDSAAEDCQNLSEHERKVVSSWIAHNAMAVITWDDIVKARTTKKPSLLVRAHFCLLWLSKKYPLGKYFSRNELLGTPDGESLAAYAWCDDLAEIDYLMDSVLTEELGYIRASVGSSNRQISPKGWMALSDRNSTDSPVGFVAMWFSPAVQDLYDDVIKPAIEATGYEPLRIDSKEHNNKIDDEIVASIRAAKFVVADYTGERGGVYYEAGFAHGLGIPVIFMAKEATEIHFDTRQFNTIFWKADDLASARDRLRNRILATLGQGPRNV